MEAMFFFSMDNLWRDDLTFMEAFVPMATLRDEVEEAVAQLRGRETPLLLSVHRRFLEGMEHYLINRTGHIFCHPITRFNDLAQRPTLLRHVFSYTLDEEQTRHILDRMPLARDWLGRLNGHERAVLLTSSDHQQPAGDKALRYSAARSPLWDPSRLHSTP